MTHRDIRVSLYGLVAGVVIGAGALAYAQHGSFTGSTVAILRPEVLQQGTPSRKDFTQRNVSKKGVPLRSDTQQHSYPTLKEFMGASSSAAAVDASPEICTAVRNAVEKIRVVYNTYIPDTLKNTEIRQNMDAAFAAAVSAECAKDEAASVPAGAVSSASVATVDNDCEKFPTHTARYTQCVLSEKAGKPYP